jgi:hypothetical protein
MTLGGGALSYSASSGLGPPDPQTHVIDSAEPNVWHTHLPANLPLYSGTRATNMTDFADNWVRGNDNWSDHS